MGDEINLDLVTKLVQHEYFKSQVAEQVKARAQAELGLWWKIVAGVVAVVLGIFSFLGIQQASDIRGRVRNIETLQSQLEKGIQDSEQRAKVLSDLETRYNSELKDLADHVRDAHANTTESSALVRSSLDLLGRSGSSITSSLASAAQLEQDLAKRADSLGEQDMLLRKQISDLQLDKKKQDIDETKEHLDDTKAYVDTEAKSLGAEIGKVKNLNYELNKAKTVEFIFLQAGEAREIKVTDYKHPENPAQDITFSAKKIRRFLDLAVVVGQGQEQAFGYLTEEVEKQIPGTDDLWFKVEAIRRRYLVFARPFAILRIYVKAKS